MYENLKGRKLTKEDKKCFEDWILKERKLSEIEKIINLEVFKTHPELLTPSVFFKTAKQIEKIVNLEAFKTHPELLTPSVFLKTPKEIERIINLEVFKTHPELLTPSVFKKTPKEIEEIVGLKVFKTHPELLTPSVFLKTAKEIEETYLLYCLYKVEEYITSSHLSLKSDEVKAKFNYIDSINDYITIETKGGKIRLHPIMLMTNKNMKLNYGITKKELMQNYRYKDAEEDYKIRQDSKIKI